MFLLSWPSIIGRLPRGDEPMLFTLDLRERPAGERGRLCSPKALLPRPFPAAMTVWLPLSPRVGT